MPIITKDNLDQRDFTNGELILILDKLAQVLDMRGFSEVNNVIEHLTGDRNFDETPKVSEGLNYKYTFLAASKTAGYRLHSISEWSYCLKKDDENNGKITFNFYWNKTNKSLFTVQTSLVHPRKGKGQLNRKNLTIKQCIQLLTNPRKHTGKGFFKK